MVMVITYAASKEMLVLLYSVNPQEIQPMVVLMQILMGGQISKMYFHTTLANGVIGMVMALVMS